MKKIISTLVIGTMIVSSATVCFASGTSATDVKTKNVSIAATSKTSETDYDEDWDDFDYEPESFTDFMGDLLKDIKSTDKDLLQKHYNAAIGFEEKEKFKEADLEWEAFDKILTKYDKDIEAGTTFEMPSYDDFMKDTKDFMKTIDEKTNKNMKKLYNEANQLDKDGKYDEASKKWDDFFKLFDGLIDESKLEECSTEEIDGEYEQGTLEDYEPQSYTEFMKEISEYLKPISKTDEKKMETIYNKISSLEKDNKFDEADKEWDNLIRILDGYFKDDIK